MAIDSNTVVYEDVLSIIRGDKQKKKKEFTSLSELRKIEALLNILEDKVYNLRHFT